jgi:hypothetical protein
MIVLDDKHHTELYSASYMAYLKIFLFYSDKSVWYEYLAIRRMRIDEEWWTRLIYIDWICTSNNRRIHMFVNLSRFDFDPKLFTIEYIVYQFHVSYWPDVRVSQHSLDISIRFNSLNACLSSSDKLWSIFYFLMCCSLTESFDIQWLTYSS